MWYILQCGIYCNVMIVLYCVVLYCIVYVCIYILYILILRIHHTSNHPPCINQRTSGSTPEGSQLSGWRHTHIAEDATQIIVFTASNWRHWWTWGGLYLRQASARRHSEEKWDRCWLLGHDGNCTGLGKDVSGCFSPLIPLPSLRAMSRCYWGGAALRAEDNKLRLVPNTSTFRVGSAILSLSVSITLLQYILLLLSTNSLQL